MPGPMPCSSPRGISRVLPSRNPTTSADTGARLRSVPTRQTSPTSACRPVASMIRPMRLLTKPWRRARSASWIACAALREQPSRARAPRSRGCPRRRPARTRRPRGRARAASRRRRRSRPRRCARSRLRAGRAGRPAGRPARSAFAVSRPSSSAPMIVSRSAGFTSDREPSPVADAPERSLHDVQDGLRACLQVAREDLPRQGQREIHRVALDRVRNLRSQRVDAAGRLAQGSSRAPSISASASAAALGVTLARSPARAPARGSARPPRPRGRAPWPRRRGAAGRTARAPGTRS